MKLDTTVKFAFSEFRTKYGFSVSFIYANEKYQLVKNVAH